jgi:glycine/D-amino acid oxidase-like deaminating enzyme
VIIAAGAWTVGFMRTLGIHLPAIPTRTQVTVFTWPEAATPLRLMSVNDYINGCYFAHEGADARHIVVGLGGSLRTPIEDLEQYGEDGDIGYAQRARECLVARVPLATYIGRGWGWAGPVTITPDDAPIIDAHPHIEGVFFATGCNGRGFKNSPAVGCALAEWALSGAPHVADLTPFRAARFAQAG